MSEIKATLRVEYGIPFWDLEVDGQVVGEAYPWVFEGPLHSTPDLRTPNGLAVRFHGIGRLNEITALAGIAVWDSAVPVNPDGSYPYEGKAISVYDPGDSELTNLEPGKVGVSFAIVPYTNVERVARGRIEKAIQETVG
jgi:hypothetical protein